MPLRIWVIGRRTSSAPSGKAIGAPAGRGPAVAARGAGGAAGADEPFWPEAGAPLAPCWAAAAADRGRAAGPDRLDDLEDVLAGDPAAAAGPDDLGRRSGRARAAGGGRRGSSGRPDRRWPAAPRRRRSSRPVGAHRSRPGRRRAPALRPVRVPGRGRGRSRGRRPAGPRPPRAGAVRPRPLGGRPAAGRRSRRVAASGPQVPRRSTAASSAVSMTAISALFGTVAPSSARISREDALERRRDLGVDLVGDDLDQRLVLVDVVARLLQPLPDRPLGDALAELGHRHLGHVRCSSVGAGRAARWVSVSALVSPIRDRFGRGPSRRCDRRERPHGMMQRMTGAGRATVTRGMRAIGIRAGEGRTSRLVAGAVRRPRGRPQDSARSGSIPSSSAGSGQGRCPTCSSGSGSIGLITSLAYGAALGRVAADPPARRTARRRPPRSCSSSEP